MEGIKKKSIVGIGRICVDSGEAEMAAYAIGSCIALCLYDRVSGVGAMAHILLPPTGYTGYENEAEPTDTRYADHALRAAIKQMCELGAVKNRIVAAVIGGAEMFPYGDKAAIHIGKMNIESAFQELHKLGIPVEHAVTGGNKSRTVTFRIPGNSLNEQVSVRHSGVQHKP